MQHSKPNITELEINAVTKAIRNGHLADGVLNEQFEQMFRDMFGYRHVVTLNSGTSAMHLGLLAMGVGPGDEVIVTPYTMVATVNVILAVGATPVFADIERDTYNLDPIQVSRKVTSKTKVVMPVDLFGVPADIHGIRDAIPSSVKILEDSIEALGSRYKNRSIGLDADAGAFGFYPNKQITTCEGGVLYSDDKDLIDRVRRLSRHGVMAGDLSYQDRGYNMRLSDLHAALGIAQLSRLWDMQKVLVKVRQNYDVYFKTMRKQFVRPGDFGTEFIYCIELPPEVNKEQFISEMGSKHQVPIKPYFNVLHTLPHLKQFYSPCPMAEHLGSRTVALPFHAGIDGDDVLHVYESFLDVLHG
jgi:perosamine synthetase